MSSTKNTSSRVSLATYLSLLGLAAIGTITFFGEMMHSSDGKPTMAFVWALVVVAVLGGLLFIAIKAKTAEDNPDKWRYVEWLCIVAYIVLAVFLAQPFMTFFKILSEKEQLQKEARYELDALQDIYSNYDAQRKAAIELATEQLTNIQTSTQHQTGNVDSDLRALAGEPQKWMKKAMDVTALDEDQRIAGMERRVNTWSLLDVPAMAIEMRELNKEIPAKIQEFIDFNAKKYNLVPVIDGGAFGNGFWINGVAVYNLPKAAESDFSKDILRSEGSTPLGWTIYIVLNILVLLSLWVAERSNYVGPTAGNKNVGGASL